MTAKTLRATRTAHDRAADAKRRHQAARDAWRAAVRAAVADGHSYRTIAAESGTSLAAVQRALEGNA